MQSSAWDSKPLTVSRQHSWPSSSSGYYDVQQTMQIQMHDLQFGKLNATQGHRPPPSFDHGNSGRTVMFSGPNRQLLSPNTAPNVTVHHTILPRTTPRNPTEHFWHDYTHTPQQAVPTERRFTSGCTSGSDRFSFGRSVSDASPGFKENNLMQGEMPRPYPAQPVQHCVAQPMQLAHQRIPVYRRQEKEVDNGASYNFNSQPVVAYRRPVLSSPCVQSRPGGKQNQVSAHQQVRPLATGQSINSFNTYLNPPPLYQARNNSVKLKPTVRYGSASQSENRTLPQILQQPVLLNDTRAQQDTESSRSRVTSYSDSPLLHALLQENINYLGEQDLNKFTGNKFSSLHGTSKNLSQQSSPDQTTDHTTDTRISYNTFLIPPAQSTHEIKRPDNLQRAAAQTRVSSVCGAGLLNDPPRGQTEGVVTNVDCSLPFRIESVRSLEGRAVEANADESSFVRTEGVGTLEGPTTRINNTDANLPFRTEDARTVLSNKTVNQSNALNATEKTSEDQLQTNVLENDSSQSSAMSQDRDRAAQNHDGQSCLHYTAFDMTDLPVFNVTLDTLKKLVKVLEARNVDPEKQKVTNVLKCITDLYWKGSIKNIRQQLKDLTLSIKNTSGFCVKDNEAVVLQHLEPKSLNLLKSHPVEKEATLPSDYEQFQSIWLNVDGPADIDKVLAEPLGDPVLDLKCHSVSKLESTSTGNAENLDHRCAILGQDQHIPINITTSDDFSKDSCSVDVDSSQLESSAKVLIPATTEKNPQSDCKGNKIQTHKHLEKEKSLTKQHEVNIYSDSESKNKHDLDTEENVVSKMNEPGVEEAGGGVDEEISEFTDVSSELIKVTLLSSRDVREIFKDELKSDPIEESQLCQDERRVLPVLSDEHPDDGCQNAASKVTFTCPHMADKRRGSDFFCPSCLGETQVLNLELDEDDSDVDTSPIPVRSEDQNAPLSLISFCLTEAAVSMPNVDISVNTSTPSNTNSHGVLESSEDQSSPQKIQSGPISSSPQKIQSGPISSSPKKTEPIGLSSDLLSKKVNLSITNAKTNKQYLNNQINASYSENSPMKITIRVDQTRQGAYKVCKKTLAKRQQGANVFGTIHRMPAMPRKPKRQSLKKRGTGSKQKGSNKGAKKVRFELFGSSKDTPSCESRDRLASTPVILTISANANNGMGYSNSSSAKQKVFEQWNKTFIPTQQKGSRKKVQSTKSELKSRVQMLKIVVNDRMTFGENHPRKRIGVANNAIAHQPKKMKSTSM